MDILCGIIKNCGICVRNGCKYLILQNMTEGCFQVNHQIPRVFKEFERPEQCLGMPCIQVGDDFWEDLLEVLGGGIGGVLVAAVLQRIYHWIMSRPGNNQHRQQLERGARISRWIMRLYQEFRGNHAEENAPLIENMEENPIEEQNENGIDAAVVVNVDQPINQQNQQDNQDGQLNNNMEMQPVQLGQNLGAPQPAQIRAAAPFQLERAQQQPSRIPRFITPGPVRQQAPLMFPQAAATVRPHGNVNRGGQAQARNIIPRNLFGNDQAAAILNIEDPQEIGLRQRNSPNRPRRAAADNAQNMLNQLRRDRMI